MTGPLVWQSDMCNKWASETDEQLLFALEETQMMILDSGDS